MQVLLVDDHVLFSSALKELLTYRMPGIQLTLASKLSEAERFIQGVMPDLVLLDLSLGHSNGLDCLVLWRSKYPELRIAILSADDSLPTIRQALASGAHGFLSKSESPEAFLGGLQLILNGQSYIPATFLSRQSSALPQPAAATPPQQPTDALTERQTEVVQLLLEGLSNKAIANKLNISEGTTKLHISAILQRLGVRNRTEAVIKLSLKVA